MTVTVTGGITFSGGLTFAPSGAAANDPYFMYNSLLLPGNGTNLAQNNTFLDGSTNNFAITRNGNTTQGTFSPYGSNWSNFFTGSSYLTAGTTASNFLCTGSATGITATFEAWVYPTAYNTGASAWMFSPVQAKGATYFNFGIRNGAVRFYWYDGGYKNVDSASTSDVPLNTWTHIAATINGTTIKIYVNGVLSTTSATYTGVAAAGLNQNDNIGVEGNQPTYFSGYISNYRLTNTVVYSSAFTPSTTPLTAISGTRLLTCQSNRFIDNSANTFAITLTGSPTVQRFSPFEPTAAYSASTIGGSGYFDGSGDYLSVANNAALNLGTGDFTIEAWIYITSFSGNSGILDKRTTTGSVAPWVWYTDTAGKLNFYTGTNYITTSTFPLNTWTHVVTSRVSGTLYQFINGVSAMTPTSVTANIDTSGTLLIGASNDGAPVYAKAYIEDLRIVKGSGVTTVTVPTSPLTAITNTSLLLNYTNAGIIDNAMMNNLETVGDAKISTAQSKFGGSSMAFDGTGDYLTAPFSVANQFGTGDFTIEFWLYRAGGSAYQTILDTRSSGTASPWAVLLNSSNQPYILIASDIASSIAVASATWTHIAICRASGTLRIFNDGVQGYSGANSTSMMPTGPLRVGKTIDNVYDLNGYIDDLRITKGLARYTTTFTPPTAALPTY